MLIFQYLDVHSSFVVAVKFERKHGHEHLASSGTRLRILLNPVQTRLLAFLRSFSDWKPSKNVIKSDDLVEKREFQLVFHQPRLRHLCFYMVYKLWRTKTNS